MAALDRTDGPTLLALTRQNVPLLAGIPVKTRREGALKGGYVAKKETAALDLILLSAGSELQHALAAADSSGRGRAWSASRASSASIASRRRTARRCSPRACRRRVAIEATVTSTWAPYVGLDGATIGIDRFGLSAPGSEVMKELGITAEHVVSVAKALAST